MPDTSADLRQKIGAALDRFCAEVQPDLEMLVARWKELQPTDSDDAPSEEAEDIELLWDRLQNRFWLLDQLIPNPDRDEPGPR